MYGIKGGCEGEWNGMKGECKTVWNGEKSGLEGTDVWDKGWV